MLKFEDAEKAYNNGDYTEAMQLLNDVEKAAGVTSKTLYLRIVVENKQFDNGAGLYDDIEKFNQLQKLRQHTTKYLNALANQEIDDKYREVYQISGNLKDFPNNLQEWEQTISERLMEQQQQEQEKKEMEIQKAKKEFDLLLERGNSGVYQGLYQSSIGYRYQFGIENVVSIDLEKAEYWYKKSAEQNNAVGLNNLGALQVTKGEYEEAERNL